MSKYSTDSLDFKKFIRDMRKARLKVRYYQGRNFWQGPAVVVSDISAAMAVTKVKCQYDNMGRDYIVYPHSYGTVNLKGVTQ